jgi:hypothetical protein
LLRANFCFQCITLHHGDALYFFFGRGSEQLAFQISFGRGVCLPSGKRCVCPGGAVENSVLPLAPGCNDKHPLTLREPDATADAKHDVMKHERLPPRYGWNEPGRITASNPKLHRNRDALMIELT